MRHKRVKDPEIIIKNTREVINVTNDPKTRTLDCSLEVTNGRLTWPEIIPKNTIDCKAPKSKLLRDKVCFMSLLAAAKTPKSTLIKRETSKKSP